MLVVQNPRSLRSRPVSWCALAALGLLLWPPFATAHPGQSVGLNITINDEAVEFDALFSYDFLRSFLPPEQTNYKMNWVGEQAEIADPEDAERFRTYIVDYFKDANPITIDGIRVPPVLRALRFVPAYDPLTFKPSKIMPPDLNIVLAYPTKGRPQQVNLVWELFPQDYARTTYGLPPAVEVMAELDAYEENKLIMFTEREPEVIWHAPRTTASQRVQPIVAEFVPKTVALPAFSLGLVGAWLLTAVGVSLVPAWRKGRRWAWLSVLPIVLIAYVGRGWGTTKITPPWGERVEMPTNERALEIFSALHRNIYRAFDYKTESDIYDVLSQSVAGELLDQVYGEVFESLVLRDQGGAVSRIQDVEILDARVESVGLEAGTSTPAFDVVARWRVRGAVYHWGHVHARTNEYEARYTVSERDNTWRITGADVLAQERIVMPGDDPPILPESSEEDRQP